MPVTVSSEHAGSYRLLDYTGRTYSSGHFIDGETQITTPTEGCYIIVLEDEQGNKKTQKLIVF